MANTLLTQPPVRSPVTQPNGSITPVWVQWFNSLYGQVGPSVTNNIANSYFPSVRDYGAKGDGVTDDSAAFAAAFSAFNAVFVPQGTFYISRPIDLQSNQMLFGSGNGSIIQTNANNSYDAVRIQGRDNIVANLKIQNGNAGIRLYGFTTECTQNNIVEVQIYDCNYGLLLDGYTNTTKPCYWNNFDNILIGRPKIHGVWLTKTGAGDSPNANHFTKVRVYSKSAHTTGSGYYIEYGAFNNTITDADVDLATTAHSCIRLGAHSTKTILINPYTETKGSVINIQLDAGSIDTAIYNLLSASAGSAIRDQSGGQYTTFNSGFPFKNRLGKTNITALTLNTLLYNTKFITGNTSYTIDLTVPYYLISASIGQVSVVLPNANNASGNVVIVTKSDASDNALIISEDGGGPGPAGRNWILSNRYDYIKVVSNGAAWYVESTNLFPIGTFFYSAGGTFNPDLSRSLYLVSAFTGTTSVVLPNAGTETAIGRPVTIKKTDTSTNTIIITESGGSGPDGGSVTLTSQYNTVTVVSNGAQYYILNQMPFTGTFGNINVTSSTIPANGIYRPASNALGFASNTTYAGEIDAAQRWLFGYTASITTNTLQPKLQVVGTDSDTANIGVYRYSNNATQPRFTFSKSRGTAPNTQTAVSSGDILGSIDATGSNGTTFNQSSQIIFEADAAFSGVNSSGRMRLLTATSAGTLTESLKIDSAQLITATNITFTSTVIPPNGFYLPAANQLGIATNTTSALQIDSSQRMLFGTTTSITTNTLSPRIQAAGIDSNTANIGIYRYSNNATQPRISFSKSLGATVGTNTAVTSGTGLGSIDFSGSNGTTFNQGVQIIGEAEVTFATTNSASRLRLLTATTAGTLTEGLRVDSKQNVSVGTAALATTATDGFLYIPTCAGAPTGVPTTKTGLAPMVFDTTNSKFWIYTGGAWKGIILI